MSSDSPVSSDHSEEAGAPVKEIEITPEMIEAGISILFDYDSRFSNERDIVEKIIRLIEPTSQKNLSRE
jgi:hypothetical protein